MTDLIIPSTPAPAPTITVVPDAEELVIDYLLSQPEIFALVSDRVSHKVPPDDTTATTRIVVHQPSSTMLTVDTAWANASFEQIDCYGPSEYRAMEIARTAEATLLAMKGVFDIGVVQGVRQVLGRQRLPDPGTGRPRVLFEIAVFLHPNP